MRHLLALAALLVALPAHALVMEWVTVGDPGNTCDTQYDGCFGSVDYVYRISKYEVTNAQYAEFLNAVAETDTYGLYNTNMANSSLVDDGYGGIARSGISGSYTYSTIAGRENMPVNWVSYYDALRFVNWLNNGQGSADTETGAYTLLGGTPIPSNWMTVTRNSGATTFLTSEDEWYKAAYYDAVSTSYFDYPAATDTQIVCALPGATANTANCNQVMGGTWGDLTEVGAYTGSASPNGTFDQGGNAWEWNEAFFREWQRALRGGSFFNQPYGLSAMIRDGNSPTYDYFAWGFRVAMIVECDDGLDNDGDGFTDHASDPGCADADDLSENSPTLPCDDGTDNDDDGLIDYPEDPGCRNPTASVENPACQDGEDNDGDTMIDFDGGLSALGYAAAEPDPNCPNPYKSSETASSPKCGLGTELLLLLPPLMWLSPRRRRRS